MEATEVEDEREMVEAVEEVGDRGKGGSGFEESPLLRVEVELGNAGRDLTVEDFFMVWPLRPRFL